MGAESVLPLRTFAFPVDVDRFCPLESNIRTKVFIYFKMRNPKELDALCHYLTQKGVEYVVFDYVKRYNESDYLTYMQQAKFGVILDASESQGFAIEEALSCNVPLLVWNARYISQGYGSRYADIPCSSIPYWDERCGEYFYDLDELDRTYETFIDRATIY
jgi:glycosyltransferase involved in cell wall biosynthesis